LSYFYTGAGYDRFSGLHCPILISRWEPGVVTATFDNSTDADLRPYYEVEISGESATRHLEGQITVEPHTRRDVRWSVGNGDIDLGFFILVKLDVLPVGGFASREATCGILVAGLGGMSGGQAIWLALGATMLCIIAGIVVPSLGLRPSEAAAFDREASSNARRSSQALGVAASAAVLAAFAGWWLAAVVLCVGGVLLLVISLRYSF
jgi:hypothetical protein